MTSIDIFAEMGFGNETFFSTEIEKGRYEKRVSKFIIPPMVKGIYFRFWIGKSVLVLSTKNGISLKKKDRVKIKILFGIEGIR